MQLFVQTLSHGTATLDVCPDTLLSDVKVELAALVGIPAPLQRLRCRRAVRGTSGGKGARTVGSLGLVDGDTLCLGLSVCGGMDFQNRVGSKPGAGAPMSHGDSAYARKERLRKLALESVDLAKDPYIIRNNYGSFECKLCLTLHNTEGNYLAHTQGKRHQQGLAARAARERAREGYAPGPSAVAAPSAPVVAVRKTIKIGRPGYRVVKQRDPESGQRSLRFEIEYPEIEAGLQPRHRFMGAYEQKVEPADRRYQYLLVAAEPYETIGFKIPAEGIDKTPGKFYSNWDKAGKVFTLQFSFALKKEAEASAAAAGPAAPARPRVRYD